MTNCDCFNLYNFSIISDSTFMCVFNLGLKIDFSYESNFISCCYRLVWMPKPRASWKIGRSWYSRISLESSFFAGFIGSIGSSSVLS